MDLQRYKQQIRGLRRFRAVPQVPKDPYDISVALAGRLLGYERTIHFSDADKRVYREAMAKSNEHGPCCCHCWRWSAFRGQAEYLIHNEGFSAEKVATIWDLEDGCGGPGDADTT
jgi:hypothetical protein